MVALIVLLLILAVFGGLGFAAHVLWFVLIAAVVLWLLCPESSFPRQSLVGFGFRLETKEMTGWQDLRSSRRRGSSRSC